MVVVVVVVAASVVVEAAAVAVGYIYLYLFQLPNNDKDILSIAGINGYILLCEKHRFIRRSSWC
jgi:hypothetical protein